MRDRTASRNHSPCSESFRRTHEKHRAWGLTRRHATRLRHLTERATHPPSPHDDRHPSDPYRPSQAATPSQAPPPPPTTSQTPPPPTTSRTPPPPTTSHTPPPPSASRTPPPPATAKPLAPPATRPLEPRSPIVENPSSPAPTIGMLAPSLTAGGGSAPTTEAATPLPVASTVAPPPPPPLPAASAGAPPRLPAASAGAPPPPLPPPPPPPPAPVMRSGALSGWAGEGVTAGVTTSSPGSHHQRWPLGNVPPFGGRKCRVFIITGPEVDEFEMSSYSLTRAPPEIDSGKERDSVGVRLGNRERRAKPPAGRRLNGFKLALRARAQQHAGGPERPRGPEDGRAGHLSRARHADGIGHGTNERAMGARAQ
ncbi:hypothetical protein CLV70_101458 [Pseudosporangium ferrugineum]|uniref:Uncharacterized protein n=1 Tax=Pseudosporangium ferrugineum TaxID=439699 RepID=A0A2T0SIQ1_9ACTN|nr:hypothetical protein CLV70_101458 [Pseudosporangium ferrugineum]